MGASCSTTTSTPPNSRSRNRKGKEPLVLVRIVGHRGTYWQVASQISQKTKLTMKESIFMVGMSVKGKRIERIKIPKITNTFVANSNNHIYNVVRGNIKSRRTIKLEKDNIDLKSIKTDKYGFVIQTSNNIKSIKLYDEILNTKDYVIVYKFDNPSWITNLE